MSRDSGTVEYVASERDRFSLGNALSFAFKYGQTKKLMSFLGSLAALGVGIWFWRQVLADDQSPKSEA